MSFIIPCFFVSVPLREPVTMSTVTFPDWLFLAGLRTQVCWPRTSQSLLCENIFILLLFFWRIALLDIIFLINRFCCCCSLFACLFFLFRSFDSGNCLVIRYFWLAVNILVVQLYLILCSSLFLVRLLSKHISPCFMIHEIYWASYLYNTVLLNSGNFVTFLKYLLYLSFPFHHMCVDLFNNIPEASEAPFIFFISPSVSSGWWSNLKSDHFSCHLTSHAEPFHFSNVLTPEFLLLFM